MIAYETRLDRDRQWALREGSMHFEKESAVHAALHKVTKRLEELGISYAVVGGMALFAHGFRRFTEDVDILVTADGLKEVHQQLEGLGYVPPFSGSKHLRDAEHGVRVEFLVAGQYPGDGKPKPIAFPNPSEASVEIDGIRYLQLHRLVELKLASGMSGPGRLSDLGDVEKLIRILALSRELANELNPYVQEKYKELWDGVQKTPTEL